MRAEKNKEHISGAEGLVEEPELKTMIQSHIDRALSHERGKPDLINISVEEIKSPVKEITSLPVTLFPVNNVNEGKKTAKKVLKNIRIPDLCIEKAFTLLENGPSDGQSMRGAIVMDMQGRRLELDKKRGIRASRMDMTAPASLQLEKALSVRSMSGYFLHVKEALTVASKVASVRGSVAELCWSDDPDYTAGYVASKKLGYIRLPHLKNQGDNRGGRVFFVDDVNLEDYINEIEKTPVLINKFGGLSDGSLNEISENKICNNSY